MVSSFRRCAHQRPSQPVWQVAAGPGAQQGIACVSKAKIVSIVDDDPSVRVALESLIKSQGLVVCAFASAEDFLRSRLVDDSACLVSDVQMPGMSGLDLQSRLAERGSRIPIIFITAFPEAFIRSRAEAGGAIACLEKPFDGRAIIELVRQALAAERR